MTFPSSHKAMIYDRPGNTSVKSVTVKTPGPGVGQVLVRLTHTGVCHSDHGLMINAWDRYLRPTAAGQIGGHEGIGHIVQLGAGLDDSGKKVGDRVGIKFVHNICRTYTACLAGAESCCSKMRISGYYTPGTFQEYFLAPAEYVTPIPSKVPSHLAAPLLCAGLSAYSSLKKARASPGDWIVVSGAGGGVGHLACQIASRSFGLRVIGIDVKRKESLVRDCGAEKYLALEAYCSTHTDGDISAMSQAAKNITGDPGAAAALVCTGSDSAFAECLDMLRLNGMLVVVGVQEGKERPIANASPNLFLFAQKGIVGSSVGNYKESVEVMDLAQRGLIKPHVEVGKLDDLQCAFEHMERGGLDGKVVLEI